MAGDKVPHFSEKYGVNKAQIGLLYLVETNDRITVSKLAESMGTTPSAATQLIDGLVTKGYLERVADEHDKRTVHIRFSKQGSERFKQFRDSHLKKLDRILDGFSTDEIKQLINFLERLRNNRAALIKEDHE